MPDLLGSIYSFLKTNLLIRKLLPYLFSKSEKAKDKIDHLLNDGAGMMDEGLATPLANADVIDKAFGGSVYDAINGSRYANELHGGLGVIGVIAFFVGLLTLAYRKLRFKEKDSHFFYFRRLLQSEQSDEIKKIMGVGQFDYYLLSAAAHFYSPDIPYYVRWKRRVFCWGKRRKEYARLNEFLTKKSSEENQAKEKMLASFFIDITDKLALFLNTGTASSHLINKSQCTGNEHLNVYSIGFSEEYAKKFFTEALLADSCFKASTNEEKSSIPSIIWSALGQASFSYWIFLFICTVIIPVTPIIPGMLLFWPAIGLACAFFVIRSSYLIYHEKKPVNNKINNNGVALRLSKQDKAILEKNSIEFRKQEAFIQHVVMKNNKVRCIEGKMFRHSQLGQDLQKLLDKRRVMKFHAGLRGFVDGCFSPLFNMWLMTETLKAVIFFFGTKGLVGIPVIVAAAAISASPAFIAIFTILAVVGLGLALRNGFKQAREAIKKQEEICRALEDNFDKLEEQLEKQESILDLSLYQYDRFLRRYSLEQPVWTKIKKFLNRFWVVLKRLGTGSLFYRLVLAGSVMTFVTAPILVTGPVGIPLICIFAGFFAVCYLRAYNIEKKCKRAENVVRSLNASLRQQEVDKNLSACQEEVNGQSLRCESSSKNLATQTLTRKNDQSFADLSLDVSQEDESLLDKVPPRLRRLSPLVSIMKKLERIINLSLERNPTPRAEQSSREAIVIGDVRQFSPVGLSTSLPSGVNYIGQEKTCKILPLQSKLQSKHRLKNMLRRNKSTGKLEESNQDLNFSYRALVSNRL